MAENRFQPHLIYQNVDLSIDFATKTLKGCTTLWLVVDDTLDEFASSMTEGEPDGNMAAWRLNLHCRQVTVDEVSCGGEACRFSHLDPLKSISPAISSGIASSVSPTYDIEELDLRYRAGLEVTGEGELEVEIPLSASQGYCQHPPAHQQRNSGSSSTSGVSGSAHKARAMAGRELPALPRRVPKEVAARFDRLAALQKDLLTPASAPHRPRGLADSALLQLTISYHLSDVPMEQWAGWSWCVEEGGSSRVLHGMTSHGAAGAALDGSMLDGVRCWVPCLDPSAEEGEGAGGELSGAAAIFDVSITVLPASPTVQYRVLSSGVRVSSTPVQQDGLTAYTYRFVTPERTPLYALGIFIGVVAENYSVHFYGCQGQIWLAGAVLPASSAVSTTACTPGNSMKVSPAESCARQVKHTFQGFDLALRFLHKALSRRYTYHRCTMIFVPDLECDFMAYDGFVLVNSSWLHDDTAVFIEMPAHLMLLRAYLYSWLKSGILLSSYDSEYLLHGAVGFLLDVYVEHILGVDEGRYRFFKQMESVIQYEKSSHSFSLSSASNFPRALLRKGPHFGPYLCNKSAVLMHLLSHHVGKGSNTGALGGIEQVLRCLHNITQSKPLLSTSASSATMPPPPAGMTGRSSSLSQSMPPPTPGHQYPHLTPHLTPHLSGSGLTPFSSAPHTPHHTPGYSYGGSIPNTPQLTPQVSPWNGTGQDATGSGRRERGGSVDFGVQPVDKEIYASWKYNPSEKEDFDKASASPVKNTVSEQTNTSTKPESDSVLTALSEPSTLQLPPRPQSIDRQSSITSTVSSMDGDGLSGAEGAESAAKRKRIRRRHALELLLWGSPLAVSSSNAPAFEEEQAHTESPSLRMGVTGVQFLHHLRKSCVGVAGSTLDDSFLEKWVGSAGCLLLRAVVSVDARNKKVEVMLDQPGFSKGQISGRFAYKDKVVINVVEEKEYQYSRRIDDNRNHKQTYTLHHKARRGGGRKKQADAETKALSAELGGSGGSNPLSHIHFHDILSRRRIGGEGRRDIEGGTLRAMALPVMQAAERLTAAAAVAGATGNAVKPLSQLVKFVAIDPEFLWAREIRQYVPDGLLLEQLYTQQDLLGQIQAMRSLALDRRGVGGGPQADESEVVIDCGGETLPERRWRLRALADILVNAKNDMHVSHSLLARCEAAYAIAQWQILHAPPSDPSSSTGCFLEMSENEGVTDWVGMDILIGCIRNMFMETMQVQVKVPTDDKDKTRNGGKRYEKVKKTTLFPLPNDLGNYEKTYMRDALLQALASIRARNGQTPLKVVEMLLNFAENNDNLGAVSSGVKDGMRDEEFEDSDKDKAGAKQSYNDGHYCSLLLLCLCQVQLAVVPNPSLAPNDQRNHQREQKETIVGLLKRIISVSTYFLHREQIMLACLNDDGSADESREQSLVSSSIILKSGRRDPTLDARRGFIDKDVLEKKLNESNLSEMSVGGQTQAQSRSTVTPASPGGGVVASTALQCICHAEIQLSRVMSNNPAPFTRVDSDRQAKALVSAQACQEGGARVTSILEASGVNEPFSFDYNPFLNKARWPSQVRSSAIDAKIRIGFAKFIAASRNFKLNRMRRQRDGGGAGGLKEEEVVVLERDAMDAVLLDSLRLALDVVQTEFNRKVRRAAAVSLLYSLQDIESPVAYQSVSLAEQLNAFTWFDPTGLVVIPPALVTNISATNSQLSACGNRRYNEEFRQHLSKVTVNMEIAQLLRQWWQQMTAGSMCSSDQVLRTTLWSAWSFLFFHDLSSTGHMNANANIPKCLTITENGRARDVDDINIYLEDLRDQCFPRPPSATTPSPFAPHPVVLGSSKNSQSNASVLKADRLRVVDPIDSVCHAEWALRGGGSSAELVASRSASSYPSKTSAPSGGAPAPGGGGGGGLTVLRLSRKSSVAVDMPTAAMDEGSVLEKRPAPETVEGSSEPKLLKLKISKKQY